MLKAEEEKKQKKGGRRPEGLLTRVPFLTSLSDADSILGPMYDPRM